MMSEKYFDVFSLVVIRGHSWSLVIIPGCSGHSWSLMVILGHSWSLVCTFRHNPTASINEYGAGPRHLKIGHVDNFRNRRN